jgi:large repetitive protein
MLIFVFILNQPQPTMKSFYKSVIASTILFSFFILIICLSSIKSHAQVTCTGGVPTYSIDFTGNPGGTWISPQLIRQGNCCGTASPDRCLRFDIILDANTAAVSFSIASGAVPPGALYYQIDCGPQTQVGDYTCVSGTGVHTLTFCKPGNNTNTYAVTSIPRPLFPNDDTIRVACSKPITVLGLVTSTITFNSIFPGAAGQYNNYLSCASNCSTTIVTPQTGAPAFVDYQICGFPIADQCGFNVTVCDTVRVYMYPQLTASVSPNPGSFCPSSPGVTLTSTINGGFGSLTYLWQNGTTTVGSSANYFATAAGTYTFSVDDQIPGCPSVPVTVPVNVANVVPTISRTNATCNGGSNGTATVSVAGGALPYSYLWSNGGTTSTITGLTSNTYSVTVSDAGGCTATASIVVTQPAAVAPSLGSLVHVGCNGESTGAIDINIAGGTGSYTYSWSNGTTTQDLEAVSAGAYTLTVTDANGCTGTLSATITEPGAIVPLLSGVTFNTTNISCNGGSDGSVSVSVSGGTLPYNYNWSNGTFNDTATGLSAGPISVLIIDGNGCSANANTILTEPDSLQGSLNSLSQYFGLYNVSCNGATDGSIDIDITGGTPSYTYSWSSGQTTQDISSIGAGNYTVTITDDNGCTDVVNATLTEPPALTISATSPLTANGTNIGCKGESTGQIFTSSNGGTSPYSYSWSTGSTSANLLGVPAGFYTVNITDQNGCTNLDTITLTEPDTVFALITAATVFGGFNISCYGGNNGFASVSVAGGSPPYTYIWSTGETTLNIDSLYAGDIWVTVYDINNCSAADSATLVQPSALLANASISAQVGCSGGSNGTATVSASGGTPSYQYNWSQGSTTQNVSGLSASTYYVTVTDANGCQTQDTLNMTQPPTLGLNLTPSVYASGNNISCNGGSNGSIDLSISGGFGSYSYSWSNGSTTQDISGLSAGPYTVTVTDGNGCTASMSVTLNEPVALDVDNISSPQFVGGWNVSCNGGTNGAVNIDVSGGSAPYTYYWSNGDTTQDISNVSVFTYYVTVTDVNGCTAQDSLLINEPTLLTSTISSQANVSCFGGSNATVTVSPSGSTPPYQYSIDGINFQSSPVFSNLSAGTYNIEVVDTNGCTIIQGVTITQPAAPLAIASTTITNALCNGNSDGTITIHATDGTGPYTFSIDGINYFTDSLFSGLNASSGTAYVLDANNCASTASYTIGEPAVLSLTMTPVSATCGATNGIASTTPAGGTGPYTYLWNTSATTQSISNLSPNTYTVLVTDSNGCTVTDSTVINNIPNLVLNTSQFDNLCNGNSLGTATVAIAGGSPPFSYIWSTGDTTNSIDSLAIGTYTVQVTDSNSCVGNTSVTITEPPVLSLNISANTSVSCNGGANGSFTTSVTGGVQPYQFSLDGVNYQPDSTFINLAAGGYTVYVLDQNNCQSQQNVTINQPVNALAASSASGNILCNGGSTTVTVSASGGTPAYTGDGTFTVTSGSYSYTVTDANGCTAVTSINVGEPSALTASSVVSQIVTCNGSNATVTVSGNGGTLPYSGTGIFSAPAGASNYVVTDANGCTASTTINITQPAALVVSVISSGIPCLGQTAAINVSASGGTGPYNGEGTFYVDEGTYTYIVSDANGCADSGTVSVVAPPPVIANAGADQTGCSVQFVLDGQLETGQTGVWNILNGNAIIDDDTARHANIMNITSTTAIIQWTVTEGPCSANDTVMITVSSDAECELELPTGFSPNDDGFNDGYLIKGIDRYPLNYFVVFNRWGNEVYHKDNYVNTDWTGQNNSGDNLPEGTYFVILEIKPSGQKLNTFVDLRRGGGQ